MTAPSPYLPAETLDALIAQREAEGLHYPTDLHDKGNAVPGATNRAFHLTMRDGVRVAVDTHVPAGARVPTVIRSTRYWRATSGSPAKQHLEALEAERWLRHGFALVLVDARGPVPASAPGPARGPTTSATTCSRSATGSPSRPGATGRSAATARATTAAPRTCSRQPGTRR